MAEPAADIGAEQMWHGYPDECYSFTVFADSLVALAGGHGWYHQPPMVGLRNALTVDFCSGTEAEAEASLRGWNGAWEFPMGTVATTAARVALNAQNDRVTRHIALLGTAMRQEEFHAAVIEPLLDPRTCPDRNCTTCGGREIHDLAEVFVILANGTDQDVVHLFSRWEPGVELRRRTTAKGVELKRRPLGVIPSDALEANRQYHIWKGTPLQAQEFRKTVWAPGWQREPVAAEARPRGQR